MSLVSRESNTISHPIQVLAYHFAATVAEFWFEICINCDLNNIIKSMPVVPQGAFAACKVKDREMKIAKMNQNIDQDQEKMFYHGKYLELSPLKYNSKLMNSIWGLYNRYSVHNFKKITDAADVAMSAGSQQGLPAVDKSSTKINSAKSPILVSDWNQFWGTHKH